MATGVLGLRDESPGAAELRLIVARDRQKRGLGSLLARELCFLALREGAGRDRRGRQVDLVVARCPLGEIFEEHGHCIHDFDWWRSR